MKTWYIIGIIIIAAIALWLVYGKPSTVNAPSSSTAQADSAPLSSGNTTANILSDINRTPDNTAALGTNATAATQAVQGL